MRLDGAYKSNNPRLCEDGKRMTLCTVEFEEDGRLDARFMRSIKLVLEMTAGNTSIEIGKGLAFDLNS